METLERIHWLAADPDGLDLYTDNNSLMFLRSSICYFGTHSHYTMQGTPLRCTSFSYNYNRVHIKGHDNVWADFLGSCFAASTVRHLVLVPDLPTSSHSASERPSVFSFEHVQHKYSMNRPDNRIFSERLWKNESGALWIPSYEEDQHLRRCVIARTGPAGHRGVD